MIKNAVSQNKNVEKIIDSEAKKKVKEKRQSSTKKQSVKKVKKPVKPQKV